MGHSGNKQNISGDATGSIGGTPWGYEQWYQGGSATMTVYGNGTFSANWSNSSDYLARVGYRYGDNGSGVDHKTKKYGVDYKYTKNGHGSYGYIGVYGWTVNPQTEYYIVDDWYSQPSENYVGAKFGEIEVDGATYTIHAYLRQQEPSKTGTSTFLQIFSIRKQARQCGHIDISAHFNKWDELFTGQNAQLKGSKGGGSTTLKFGRVTEVMLMNEAGGNSSGDVDYTYFNMCDDGSCNAEYVPPEPEPRQLFKGKELAVPGKIEVEDFDITGVGEGNVSYNETDSQNDGKSTYREKDAPGVDLYDEGTGVVLGMTQEGEWLEYSIDVAKAGEYTLTTSVAAGNTGAAIQYLLDGKELTKVLDVPQTASEKWDVYEDLSAKVTLSAGKHILRLAIMGNYVNVDYFTFSEGDAPIASVGGGVDGPQSIASGDFQVYGAAKTLQVFDAQGKMMGVVKVDAGSSVAASLKARFGKAGVYMVKQGNSFKRVAVK